MYFNLSAANVTKSTEFEKNKEYFNASQYTMKCKFKRGYNSIKKGRSYKQAFKHYFLSPKISFMRVN